MKSKKYADRAEYERNDRALQKELEAVERKLTKTIKEWGTTSLGKNYKEGELRLESFDVSVEDADPNIHHKRPR